MQKLLDLTGSVRLGLYECPKPYHRLLSAEALAWAASTGRFYFHKDTCCKLEVRGFEDGCVCVCACACVHVCVWEIRWSERC